MSTATSFWATERVALVTLHEDGRVATRNLSVAGSTREPVAIACPILKLGRTDKLIDTITREVILWN